MIVSSFQSAFVAPHSSEQAVPEASIPAQAVFNDAPATRPKSPPQHTLAPPRLVIELDEASNRFVQSFVDSTNETVLRRFPNESQLAFSRGVSAYIRAMRAA